MSGLAERTVQRVERAEGASPDTLQAIARAFELPVDRLTYDWVGAMAAEVGIPREELTATRLEEYARAEQAKFEAKYRLVTLRRVASTEDLDPGGRAEAMNFTVEGGSDEARDVAAE